MSCALFSSPDVTICFSESMAAAIHAGIICYGVAYTEVKEMGAAILAGIVVISHMHIFGQVSGGHGNPIVTYMSYLMGNYGFQPAIFVMISQFTGAISGYGLAKLITDGADVCVGETCLSAAKEISLGQAAIIELICSTLWLLCWCAGWDCRSSNIRASLPIRMGFAKIALTFISVKFTGASFNPARTLAVALYTKNFEHFWPFIAAQLAAVWVAFMVWIHVFPRYQCRMPKCFSCPQTADGNRQGSISVSEFSELTNSSA